MWEAITFCIYNYVHYFWTIKLDCKVCFDIYWSMLLVFFISVHFPDLLYLSFDWINEFPLSH
jgi:hypothetical protein